MNQFCFTRWHSLCDCLERLVTLKRALLYFKIEISHGLPDYFWLSDLDWLIVETLLPVLMPFKIILCEMQNESSKYTVGISMATTRIELLKLRCKGETLELDNRLFLVRGAVAAMLKYADTSIFSLHPPQALLSDCMLFRLSMLADPRTKDLADDIFPMNERTSAVEELHRLLESEMLLKTMQSSTKACDYLPKIIIDPFEQFSRSAATSNVDVP